MNNSIAVHSHTDLINIYNNECNNYSESVNNRQYNIDTVSYTHLIQSKSSQIFHIIMICLIHILKITAI